MFHISGHENEGRIRRIGLTGGIGSGKSQAAAFFQEAAFPLISMDTVGHDLLLRDEEVRQGILQLFGSEMLEGQELSREKIGARVFQDPEALNHLNALIHPAIAREALRRCAGLEEEGHEFVLIEAALFAEDLRREDWLHGLILVSATREVRIRRLQEQRQMSVEEIEQRMIRQTDPEKKKALADWVLFNNGSLEELRVQVMRLADELRIFFGKSSLPPEEK
ncbi:MAG: dephospho-CoA kinase [Candidatus Hydrogenedens sp.]|jgi:dephospho-CoA kinase|nr:dephospho-CoA kinase [Candidatus Hydrogenedens sp.]